MRNVSFYQRASRFPIHTENYQLNELSTQSGFFVNGSYVLVINRGATHVTFRTRWVDTTLDQFSNDNTNSSNGGGTNDNTNSSNGSNSTAENTPGGIPARQTS
jgi:hypothetical protein